MMRRRHPKKEVEEALAAILADQWWHLEQPRKTGHVWGVLKCGLGRGGCLVRIPSTPQSPSEEGEQLEREARSCRHRAGP